MKFLTTIGDAIWAKLEPLLTDRLDKVEADANKQLNDFRADANAQLDKFRTDSMAMLKQALPEMAGKVSEEAVKTVFEHTHIDEAANSVSDAFIGIFDRLPKF
jgi:F0F1-type ATP synthase membrane subunit b/b'